MKRRVALWVWCACLWSMCLSAQQVTHLDWEVLAIDSVMPRYSEVIPLGEDYARYDHRVRIDFPEYAEVTAAERTRLQRLQADTLPAEIRPAVHIAVSRRQGYMDLDFVPLVKRDGRYYKLMSARIVIDRRLRNTAAVLAAGNVSRALQVRKNGTPYASRSVLSEGRWVKIRVTREGVHRLTPSLLRSMGFANPARVKLYGYGGHVLDSVLYAGVGYDDLEEVPLYRTSGALLFYANALVSWTPPSYDSQLKKYTAARRLNDYANEACYFLTEGDDPMDFPQEESVAGAIVTVKTFPENVLYEVDDYAWYYGGRNLYDAYNYATGSSRNYTLDTPDAVADEGAALTVSFAVASASRTSLSVYANGTYIGSQSFRGLSEHELAVHGTSAYSIAKLKANSATNTVRLTLPDGVEGRLDYLALNYTRSLNVNTQLAFRYPRTAPTAFELTKAAGSEVHVWRLGEPGDPVTEVKPLASTAQGLTVAVDDPMRRYVAVDVTSSVFPEPVYVGTVPNQNLHGREEIPDMVILVPQSGKFRAQAERLAEAHRQYDGMDVLVVNAGEVYNEFSSGTPDATAYRRLMKMFYDRAVTPDEAPRYLLLFGSAAGDNRMLTDTWRGIRPSDFLLCYESANSLSETKCFVMEDYFGLLDDGEGGKLLSDKVDLGVGRFPVQTEEEARIMVDKTIDYITNVRAAAWKNVVCVLGDDGDNDMHMKDANVVANEIQRNYPSYDLRRIMWDAYPRETSNVGYSFPLVTARILSQLSEGALLMNYTGHGAAICLSHEYVIKLEHLRDVVGANLPLWFTAACDVMPFDSRLDHLGRAAVLNPKGGAIAFVGTTRTVFASGNSLMNRAFTKAVLGSDETGRRNRIGDAMRQAKVALGGSTDENKLHYALLGDPALVLGSFRYRTVVDEINGQPVKNGAPTISAGTKVTVSGRVLNENGTLAEDFNGVLTAKVFDSETTVIGQNHDGKGKPYTYKAYDKNLYSGSDSVRSGRFALTFPVPTDINYSDENGRMVMYAVNEDKTMEANGYCENFLVGGTGPDIGKDKEGPEVFVYLNEEGFRDGDVVNATPYFVARVKDGSGINTTGNGVGHDLELMIDDDPEKTYRLNEYFYNDFGDYTSGQVAFSIPALQSGKHTLRFRVWDVQNNSTTARLAFVVSSDVAPSLLNVTATANPATTATAFVVHYNRPGTQCNFKVEVMDYAGRMLWTNEQKGLSTDGYYPIEWNLTTGGGMPLQTGVYLYRVTVWCDGSEETSDTKKILILRNK